MLLLLLVFCCFRWYCCGFVAGVYCGCDGRGWCVVFWVEVVEVDVDYLANLLDLAYMADLV